MLNTVTPLIETSYRLARVFGWTPAQIRRLTMAEARIYLEMWEMDHE